MSLPVSQYEALLAEVRGLRRKAQRVQQLATPLLSNSSIDVNPPPSLIRQQNEVRPRTSHKMEPHLTDVDTCSEDDYIPNHHNSEPNVSTVHHGTWPMWNSDPTRTTPPVPLQNQIEVTSVMSFASSSGGALIASPCLSRRSSQQLEAKVDMVYSLLAMLSAHEHADMGETLLALSTNLESCLAMRQSGCIPLLVQMVQSDKEPETRKKAAEALHNLVHSQPDEKLKKREVRVFKLLEHVRGYTEALKGHMEFEEEVTSSSEDDDRHPVQTVAHLMKLSFDELHRQAICTLGGIHAIANLVETEHVNHGSTTTEQHCILMRRYACMALTNLTFGDSGNKALLCSYREFMRALVIQLQSPSDELRQVTASVLRNLSWRADSTSKEILREVGSVTGLMKAAMLDNKENTLKSILSALWNLSAHCTENKSEICSVEGALGFLVDMLTYNTPSKSLAIIENSGGILRNVSSQIAVRDDYRDILRQHNCLQILLDQLKSPSLTIVSNACGTLWNLSAKCASDQEALWEMGAPAMLRSLNHSKHKMIAMGSSAALKNLLSARPTQALPTVMDSTALAMDLPALPTLGARKQKALLQDLDHTLSETYENIDKDSPIKKKLSVCEASTSNVKKEADNRSYTDSGLDSGSSVDNDKSRKEAKLKEVSVCSDEKDHCSLEEDSDLEPNSSFSSSGLAVRKEPPRSSNLSSPSLPLPAFKYSPNVTMFEGDIDEIDMDDISINFREETEKQDTDNEKKMQPPRSLPRPIPGRLTSTPIGVSEAPKVESIDVSDQMVPSTSQSEECSFVDFIPKDERERLLERSCGENNPMDNRMLDPDAMIQSLDRFTAELVSQASHLQSNEDKYKDNTWNDDTSPNVTFPSISGSAPNVITFNSSGHEEEAKQSNDFTSSTMTESTLIAIEASKMATVFQNEAETLENGLELDNVQPPSLLESVNSEVNSPKLTTRKLKGLMVKRALSNSLNNNSSDSLLDHVNPPSAMGEVLDMDGSLASVASLPIESSNTKLDNINPPSLFNDITDLCNSLIDVPTEAIASETEIFEDCNTHIDDVTEFSDANSATPIQSDPSSPEVSPRKKTTLLKQRRSAKDRYKTYTVTAPKEEQSTSEDFQTVDQSTSEYQSVIDTQTYSIKNKEAMEPPTSSSSPTRSKLSIRRNFLQKRLENKDRFKTQTLLTPLEHQVFNDNPPSEELLDCETLSLVSNDEDSEQNSPNYRTYHKNWGLKKNIPVIDPTPQPKPKIVKPSDEKIPDEPPEPKAIRGKRKPLYSKPLSRVAPKTTPILVKKPVVPSRASSGYGTRSNSPAKPKIERQGTFTKDDAAGSTSKSRIPTSRIPTYGRSTSADSTRRVQSAPKKSLLPVQSGSQGNLTTKKQVTSKIASLWKKIEENKNKPAKKDTRVWIQSGVEVRGKKKGADDGKRVSRLGSFIVMDEAEGSK